MAPTATKAVILAGEHRGKVVSVSIASVVFEFDASFCIRIEKVAFYSRTTATDTHISRLTTDKVWNNEHIIRICGYYLKKNTVSFVNVTFGWAAVVGGGESVAGESSDRRAEMGIGAVAIACACSLPTASILEYLSSIRTSCNRSNIPNYVQYILYLWYLTNVLQLPTIDSAIFLAVLLCGKVVAIAIASVVFECLTHSSTAVVIPTCNWRTARVALFKAQWTCES